MNLPAFLQQAPPDVAVDIAPGRVAVARVERAARGFALAGHAVEALPEGAVSGALAAPNMPDLPVVGGGGGAGAGRGRHPPGRVALVVPDSIARVSLVRFETVPARGADLDELIRWQIKKTTPFPLDEAVVAATPGATAGRRARVRGQRGPARRRRAVRGGLRRAPAAGPGSSTWRPSTSSTRCWPAAGRCAATGCSCTPPPPT